MITAEQLKKVNENLKTIPIKGKIYAPVYEQVKAFRQICPEGSITSELVHFTEEECVIKATVMDEDGRVLSTGYAWEKRDSSFINKTSFVENCETSARGRALSALGIGADESMATAEELANALINQGNEEKGKEEKKASRANIKTFKAMCDTLGLDQLETLKKTGWKKGDMTEEQYARACVIFKEVENNGQ